MENIKIGSWVRHPSFEFPAVVKEITENEISIFNIVDGWFHIDCDFENIILWEPKEGEWCWYGQQLVKCSDSKLFKMRKESELEFTEYRKTYVFSGCDSFHVNDHELEPFVGELPSWWAKEK